MGFPGGEDLSEVNTGLTDRYAAQIVVFALQSLGLNILAEGAEHGEDMGLSHILNLMGAKYPYRQYSNCIVNRFRTIGTKIPDDLSACPFFQSFWYSRRFSYHF